MNNRNITYVIHIATTAEALWETLTNPEALKKNWGRIESQWKVGSTVRELGDTGKVLWKGEVLQSDPPNLLSYTFDVSGGGEPPTKVTFELTPPATEVSSKTSIVRLTVTQEGFEDTSKLFAGCARAWPEILSSMKTYLETGHPLPFLWKH
jgi:uncharacterized protein YndB with AHSA1/START domain